MSCLRDVHLIRDTPARLLTTPLYRLPLSSKPFKSLAESLRNRHGARTPPQPPPAGRGRLRRATGGRTIGAGRMTADIEAATNPTPAADQPARHRRPASSETLRLYAADWAAFEDWCRGRALATLPADPTTVAAFLSAGAETLGAGALGRRAAAIGDKHRQVGLASAAADRAVTAILHADRRSATPR